MTQEQLEKKMENLMIDLAKKSDADPNNFISAYGTSFLRLCDWISSAINLDKAEKLAFWEELLISLTNSINNYKRKAQNERV